MSHTHREATDVPPAVRAPSRAQSQQSCLEWAAYFDTLRNFRGTWFAMFREMHSNQNQEGNQIAPADAQLRSQIEAEMHQHGQVDATKIGVVVRGGQVLLWGSVASEHERTLASKIACRLTGKTAVINHIQVYRTTQN